MGNQINNEDSICASIRKAESQDLLLTDLTPSREVLPTKAILTLKTINNKATHISSKTSPKGKVTVLSKEMTPKKLK